MKAEIRFKIWDTKEVCYLADKETGSDLEFADKMDADDFRWDYLSQGNYPDEPFTVLQIHEFTDNQFSGYYIM